MNAIEKELLSRLEAMPLEEARVAIHTRAFGDQFGSPNHDFCLSWLAAKDATLQIERGKSTERWARHAAYAAYAAAAIAAISIITTIFMSK
jgi:hypothetical protein